jgi:hypothetical protein
MGMVSWKQEKNGVEGAFLFSFFLKCTPNKEGKNTLGKV